MKKYLLLSTLVLCQLSFATEFNRRISEIPNQNAQNLVRGTIHALSGLFSRRNSVKVVRTEPYSLGECIGMVQEKKRLTDDFKYSGTLRSFPVLKGQAQDYYTYEDARRMELLFSRDSSLGFLLKRGLKNPRLTNWASVPADIPAHGMIECSPYFDLGKIDLIKNGEDTCRRIEFVVKGLDNSTKELIEENYHMLYCSSTTKVYVDYHNFDFEVLEVIQSSEDTDL